MTPFPPGRWIVVKALEQSWRDEGPFCFEGTIDDVINSLLAIRATIPPESVEETHCLITVDLDGEAPRIELIYRRRETEEEIRERLPGDAHDPPRPARPSLRRRILLCFRCMAKVT